MRMQRDGTKHNAHKMRWKLEKKNAAPAGVFPVHTTLACYVASIQFCGFLEFSDRWMSVDVRIRTGFIALLDLRQTKSDRLAWFSSHVKSLKILCRKQKLFQTGISPSNENTHTQNTQPAYRFVYSALVRNLNRNQFIKYIYIYISLMCYSHIE